MTLKIASSIMRVPEVPENGNHARAPSAALMLGESAQGFLSAKSLPPRIDEKLVKGSFTRVRVRELL